MAEHACPDCPHCGNPPKFVLGVTAFCGTEGCMVLSWLLTETPAENLRHAKEIEL